MIYAPEAVNMFFESVSRFLSSENELLCFCLVFRKLTCLSEEPGFNFVSDSDYPCWHSYVLLISPSRRVPQHCLQYVLSLPVLSYSSLSSYSMSSKGRSRYSLTKLTSDLFSLSSFPPLLTYFSSFPSVLFFSIACSVPSLCVSYFLCFFCLGLSPAWTGWKLILKSFNYLVSAF